MNGSWSVYLSFHVLWFHAFLVKGFCQFRRWVYEFGLQLGPRKVLASFLASLINLRSLIGTDFSELIHFIWNSRCSGGLHGLIQAVMVRVYSTSVQVNGSTLGLRGSEVENVTSKVCRDVLVCHRVLRLRDRAFLCGLVASDVRGSVYGCATKVCRVVLATAGPVLASLRVNRALVQRRKHISAIVGTRTENSPPLVQKELLLLIHRCHLSELTFLACKNSLSGVKLSSSHASSHH